MAANRQIDAARGEWPKVNANQQGFLVQQSSLLTKAWKYDREEMTQDDVQLQDLKAGGMRKRKSEKQRSIGQGWRRRWKARVREWRGSYKAGGGQAQATRY